MTKKTELFVSPSSLYSYEITYVFVKVKSIRSRLGVLGDRPGGLVGDELALLSRNRAEEEKEVSHDSGTATRLAYQDLETVANFCFFELPEREWK